jgi:hypothetical protein
VAAAIETQRRIANRERLHLRARLPDLKGAKDLVARLGDSVVFYKIGSSSRRRGITSSCSIGCSRKTRRSSPT